MDRRLKKRQDGARKTFEQALSSFVLTEMTTARTFLELARTEGSLRQFQRAEELLQKARTAHTAAVNQMDKAGPFTFLPPEIEATVAQINQALSDVERNLAFQREKVLGAGQA
jgi:hypothetical protein